MNFARRRGRGSRMGSTSAWRVHVIAGLLVLLLACSSASAADLDSRGLKLAGEGKWAEAITQYNKALAKDASYRPALYHITEAHLALLQDSEAIEYHEKLASLDEGMAAELQTSISGSYRRHADAAFAAKIYSDAATSYERAIALNAALAPELNPDLAAAYTGRGAESRSLADLNKALELRPGFAEAHARRGELYIAQGNNDAGIADLEVAVMLQPDLLRTVVDPLSAALITRATVRLGAGAWPDAFVDFGRVIELRDSLGVETPVFALVTSTNIQFSFPVGSGNETLMWNRPATRDNSLEYRWLVETVVGIR